MVTWNDFLITVNRSFGFLQTLGFSLTSDVRPFAIYSSDRVSVLIYYDINGSRELDVAIRKKDDDPKRSSSIGIGILKMLNEQHKAAQSSISYPKTVEELETKMTQAAGILRIYGEDILKGDLSGIDAIRKKEAEAARMMMYRTNRR
jgi:hypothetical protein